MIILCAQKFSHPGKPWKTHKKLADHILEEFFLQGDEESKLGLPFSPLCDRTSVLVPESQISFIEYIVEPSLSVLGDLIDYMVKDDEKVSVASLKQEVNPVNQKGKALKYGRRAESDALISSIGSSSTGNIKPELRMLTEGGRTSSFPLQPDQAHQLTVIRPWLNHLQENKAKWKMIATGN